MNLELYASFSPSFPIMWLTNEAKISLGGELRGFLFFTYTRKVRGRRGEDLSRVEVIHCTSRLRCRGCMQLYAGTTF